MWFNWKSHFWHELILKSCVSIGLCETKLFVVCFFPHNYFPLVQACGYFSPILSPSVQACVSIDLCVTFGTREYTRDQKIWRSDHTWFFFRPERKGSAQGQIGPQLHRGLGGISEQEVGQRGGGQPQPLTGRRKEEVEVTWRHLEHQISHRVSLNQTCWRERRNVAWISYLVSGPWDQNSPTL